MVLDDAYVKALKNTCLIMFETILVIIILISVFSFMLKILPEPYDYYKSLALIAKISAAGWPVIIGLIIQRKLKNVRLVALTTFLMALILLIAGLAMVDGSHIDGINLLFLLIAAAGGLIGAELNKLIVRFWESMTIMTDKRTGK